MYTSQDRLAHAASPPHWVCLHSVLNIDGTLMATDKDRPGSAGAGTVQASAPALESTRRQLYGMSMLGQCGSSRAKRCLLCENVWKSAYSLLRLEVLLDGEP